jgi:hypothetical protein
VVEEDHGVMEVHETPEGKRLLPGLNIAASTEDVEQVRQGYRCINCWEPLENAWPKGCPLCGFPIADKQSETFARVYKGYDATVNGQIDWDREAERLEARAERRAWAKRARESGIVLGGRRVGEAIKRMKGAS